MNDTLRECGRCGRLEYAAEAQIDMMRQPDGQPCGGVFTQTVRAEQEQLLNAKFWTRFAAAEARAPEEG